MSQFEISGQIVDVIQRRIYSGIMTILNQKIVSIKPGIKSPASPYIIPGFIDAHVHIESSMLIPSEFARLASIHGTVATVSDPHEIANVLGVPGIRYMIANSQQVPFHFYFGIPSCVPATEFETAGAVIDPQAIEDLFKNDHLHYLSEMMNYPGVLNQDPIVMQKIACAQAFQRPIDGHAPGLMGEEAIRYIEAGISTDHECYMYEEALHKLKHGMKILIREGSAAKNYDALHTLIKDYPDKVMFCSDDKHPHELVKGHINQLVQRSINEKQYDLMDVLRAASYNPIQHYQLEVGLLQPGDSADFLLVNNLSEFKVMANYIKGQLVARNGETLIKSRPAQIINNFNCAPKNTADFQINATPGKIKVIQALDGQLITKEISVEPKIENGMFAADPARDILKIAVVNRYQEASPAIAFINQFGLKSGAIASCIAHDSHNIICVGTNDEDMCAAVNAIIENKGGISVARQGKIESLSLPVAGILSAEDGFFVAEEYSRMDRLAKELGTSLSAPFMTLSFMALLVIPNLKLSDKGLFDVTRFAFTSMH
jgi:adenine deaminase